MHFILQINIILRMQKRQRRCHRYLYRPKRRRLGYLKFLGTVNNLLLIYERMKYLFLLIDLSVYTILNILSDIKNIYKSIKH